MNTLKRIFPRASANGILGRFFGRRTPGCFLLGKGFRVSGPRCVVCGKDLNLPDRRGEAFPHASPIIEPKAKAGGNGACSWLFVGSKALIATVSSQLFPLLEISAAFFGEKVVVAMATTGGKSREPLLFCSPCGTNLLAKVSPPSRKYYGWDWLAELEPRSSA